MAIGSLTFEATYTHDITTQFVAHGSYTLQIASEHTHSWYD